MYIKTGSSTWKNTAQLYMKTDASIWQRIRQGYIKIASSTWKRFFYEANLPTVNTRPTIRTTNTGSGTIYDGPIASSPQYLNADLFGKDGSYNNYTSITGRKFSTATSADAAIRSTVIFDDRFTSAGGVTSTMRLNLDEQYLFYEIQVNNGTGDDYINPVSDGIKLIKSFPNVTSFGWSQNEEIGTQLAFNYNLENYYYNKVEAGSSYIRWWRSTSTNPGGTLIKEETISSTTTSTSSSSLTGTSYYTPTISDSGYYIVAQIIAVSSYTRHYGYTDNYSLASYPTGGVITSALTIYNGTIEDTVGNRGTDNRGDVPVGATLAIRATVSGVNSSTSYRIRYRAYNWQNGLYYNISTGASGTASSVWTTYTADGTGSGNISSVIISGGIAQIKDYFSLDATYFGSTTYNSGQYRWQVEIELSAIKTGGTRVYLVNPYVSYYIQPSANSTISVSPATISPGSSTTISGSFSGYPSGTAYPYQYKVDYGDGTNSGWLPVGGYSYGTGNPTYSLTKTYYSAATYSPSITTIPYYTSNSTSVLVANLPTAPTSTSISSVTRLTDSTCRVIVDSFGGSGPYYQMYWTSNSTAPDTANYDAASTTSTVTEDQLFASGITYYFYIRSSTQNLGNTVNTGVATAGTYGPYGPSTGAASYTFASPSGGSASISGSTSVGSTLTLTKTDASGSPTPTASIVWRRADGGTGGNSFTGGSILQTGGTTYVIDSPLVVYSSVGYAIRAEISYNNGLGVTTTVNSNSIVVTAAAVAPSNTSTPTLSPTSLSVGTQLTAGIGSWSGTTPITYDLRIYRGTAGVLTSETLVASTTTTSSATTLNYTITQTDYDSGQRYFRTYVNATNSAGSSGFIGGQERGPIATPVIAPSGGSVSISTNTGNYSVGSIITYSTSGWANSPTSYYLELHNGTNPVLTSDPLRASTTSTSGTYTITSSDVPNYFKAWATATNSAGSTQAASAQVGPAYTPVSIPSGGSVTLSGTAAVGQVLSASTSGWSGSPTSYDLRIVRGTQGVIIQETLVASSTSTSVSYTVKSADVGYYFKAFAAATNSAGTSSFVASAEKGPVPTVAVTPPGTPTIGSVSGSGSVSWSAPTSGGAVASYEIEFYTASSSAGANAAGPYTVTGISGSPYQLTSPYGGTNANWARARVRARNSGGVSAYSAWAPSATTYA